MRGLLYGSLYSFLWYWSIVSGFFWIYCPILIPIFLINPQLARKCCDLVFSFWEVYPAALLEMLGVKIIVSGDHISPAESSILIMNHRTRVDWNFLWAAMYQACLPSIASHRLKFILKDPIRHIPGAGWVMQMSGFLYITRHWEVDRIRLAESLDYLVELGRRTQILIFPEGTDLSQSNIVKSNKFADAHNLPKHSYTLHPKTTGFSYLTRHLQSANFLDAVYDLTIAFPDHVPQTELDIVKGNFPKEVHFHIKRIPCKDLPIGDQELRRWLEKRWYEKERSLREFSNTRSLSMSTWPETNILPLRIAFWFWTLLTVFTTFLLFFSPIFQLWAAFTATIFVGLSIFTKGFSQVEMKYSRWKKSLQK